MRVSTSAFYAWNQQPEMTEKNRRREAFDIKVRNIFEENRRIYGSRRISKALKERQCTNRTLFPQP
ncbi:[weak similarity to] integrase catalytic region [methanotrophic bacterial endosymbiont of Bathymodiolus sp.]|nr:[weak similarity to] integrase catalytic region [methanotrophic bacterial endosymbiont of Bathymodiolus sp.]